MVPVDGLEPSHPKAGDFESPVSTNSTTLALNFYQLISKFSCSNRLVVADAAD
jgi:hypothetical protein